MRQRLLISFKRSRLTFNFSAKVAHIVVPSTHENIVSSETTRPTELKFHMKSPYDRLAKIYTNCTGHMTKQLHWSHDQDSHHAHIW